jgi:hypothetical protein
VLKKLLFTLLIPSLLFAEHLEDWGPFYRSITTQEVNKSQVFGPFFEKSTNLESGATLSAVRPLFSFWNYGNEEIDNWDLLWPIGERDVTLMENKSRVLIFGQTEEFKALTHESFYHSYWMWPLVWFKSETGRPFSSLIIPFYGNYNNFLISDKVNFILFPIYSRFQRKDAISTNWFWPFYNQTKGEHINRFRLFPFYSKSMRENGWIYRSYLWPFFHTQHSLNPQQPADAWFFFPFYGKSNYNFPKIKKNKKATTVLWPFYTYYQTTYADHPEKNRSRTHLYPFYVHSDQMQEKGSKIRYYWPFYGSRKRGKVDYKFIIWPFWNHWSTDLTHQNFRETTFFFPFYLHTTQHHLQKGVISDKKTHGRLWPLYRFNSHNQDFSYNFLALFPYYEEAIERNYSPLWTLYSYKHFRGVTSQEFLWGLFYSRKSADHHHCSIFPLIEYDHAHNGDYQVDFLKGLIGWGKTEGKRELKLLWFIHL